MKQAAVLMVSFVFNERFMSAVNNIDTMASCDEINSLNIYEIDIIERNIFIVYIFISQRTLLSLVLLINSNECL